MTERYIELRPWTLGTDLAGSRAIAGMVELPKICGKHVVHYPAVLVDKAMRSRFYSFMGGSVSWPSWRIGSYDFSEPGDMCG